MTIHVKTALILLATLIIGIVCGTLLSGLFIRNRVQNFAGPPGPDMITRRMERVIQPTESQRADMDRIFSTYGPKFSETTTRHREEIRALVDSLHKDLEPILTEEQLERFRMRRERGKEFFERRPGQRRGPGPPGRMRRPD